MRSIFFATLLVALVTGCGSPTAPDRLPDLAVLAETAAYTYRVAPNDTIDTAWQEAYHTWAVAALQVSLPRRIIYNKYLSREHMGQQTGNSGTNGFATSAAFEFHTIWPTDNHEVVHVLTATFGSPVALFNEGIAVAHQTNPSQQDFVAKWNGTSVHDHARTFRRNGQLAPIARLIETSGFRSFDANFTYPQAGSFVRWTLDTWGLAKMKAFFARGTPGDSAAGVRSAFLDIFGVTIDDAEQQWLAFLGA